MKTCPDHDPLSRYETPCSAAGREVERLECELDKLRCELENMTGERDDLRYRLGQIREIAEEAGDE